MRLLCACYAPAMRLLCARYAPAMRLLCGCYAAAMLVYAVAGVCLVVGPLWARLVRERSEVGPPERRRIRGRRRSRPREEPRPPSLAVARSHGRRRARPQSPPRRVCPRRRTRGAARVFN